MTTTSPESLALLGRAAELRASGIPWADAAAQLALAHDELRCLVAEYPRDYERLARRARTDVLRETLDAALDALRANLKSPEPGVSMRAATTIVRYELARMRHGTKEAGSRLDRDTRRSQHPTVSAQQVRTQNVSESPKVPNQQEVNAAKNVAQSPAPQSASPVSPKPTPATPPVASSSARAAAPVAPKSQAPLDDATRRKQRLVDDFALGHTAAVPAPNKRETLEVDQLISGWLTDGK